MPSPKTSQRNLPLCLSVFDWASYKRTKGAVKLHMVLDRDGYLPGYAVITDGKTADIAAAKGVRFAPDTMLVFDRGYADHNWWLQLTRQQVHFVTRLKDTVEYGIVEPFGVPRGKNILRDEAVVLCSQQDIGPEALPRRIEIRVGRRMAASTIAAIYKERWQIELFFKSLKQSMKIKTFVGTSENAVQTRIWTALIAMLLIKSLQMKSVFDWSLSNLVALLRQQLFVYRDPFTWPNNPFQPPPALDGIHDAQLTLTFIAA